MASAPRFAAPVVPYVAVLVGLYALHSAWAAMLLYHAGIVAFWIAVGREPSPRVLRTGFRASLAIPLVVAALAAGPLIWLAWPRAAIDPDMAAQLARFGLSGPSLVAFAVYAAIANAPLEELYWRGLIAAGSPRPAPADALFAGYHVIVLWLVVDWPFALAAALVLAAAAWLWRIAAARCGGLAVPYLSHLAADLAVIGAVWMTMS